MFYLRTYKNLLSCNVCSDVSATLCHKHNLKSAAHSCQTSHWLNWETGAIDRPRKNDGVFPWIFCDTNEQVIGLLWKNDWHHFYPSVKTFFFTSSRTHSFILPLGILSIYSMCHGFMMWDVIRPPSRCSKWMCISLTVTCIHICLATAEKWKAGEPHTVISPI